MSFKASILIDGKTWRVLNCQYSFSQPADVDTGLPMARVRGGSIDLEIESTGDLSFAAWMLDSRGVKNGTITFYQRDGEQRLKDIKFKSGFLIFYKEQFSNHGDQPMVESVTISSQEITITSSIGGGGEIIHQNHWPNR